MKHTVFSRRSDWIALTALVLLTAITWLPRLHGPIDMRWDGGVYYTLGTSLAQGDGYRLLNEPGNILAVQYPPGLPLLIAAHEKAAGTSDFVVVGHWLRITYFLLSLVYAAAVFRLARDYLTTAWAALATALCMLAFQTLYMSDLLYTEIPFALTATLFVLSLRRTKQTQHAIGAGLLAMTAYLLRTAGIALLATWVFDSLLRRRFKEAAIRAAFAVLPVLAWQGYIHWVTSSDAYHHPTYAYQRADYQYSNVPYSTNVRLRDPFAPERGYASTSDMLFRALLNTRYIPVSIGQAVSTLDSFWKWPLERVDHAVGKTILPDFLANVPLLLLGFLALAGLVILALRREWPVMLLTLFSLGLVCLTPWPEQFTRYMAPIIPMLLVSLVVGLAEVSRRSASTKGIIQCAGPALLIITVLPALLADAFTDAKTLHSGLYSVNYTNRQGTPSKGGLLFYTPPWQSLGAAWDWVRANANAGDVLATTVPHNAFVRTGVKSILLPLESDPTQELRMLDSADVRFVVTDDLSYPGISQKYAGPAILSRPDVWRPVFESSYRGKGDPAPSVARVYERITKQSARPANDPHAPQFQIEE